MLHSSAEERARRFCCYHSEAPHALRAHPRPEHVLPAAVVAGVVGVPPNDSGFPLTATRSFEGWVRGSMSLACYHFVNERKYFSFLDPLPTDRPDTGTDVILATPVDTHTGTKAGVA